MPSFIPFQKGRKKSSSHMKLYKYYDRFGGDKNVISQYWTLKVYRGV